MFYLLYNILAIILFPVYIMVYVYRLICGKDTLSSIASRLVLTNVSRPAGKVVWLHAASVGESMVALTVIEGLSKKDKDLSFLITTGTLSSAQIISKFISKWQTKKWKAKNCYHHFTPNDNIICAKLFLYKWKPDLALFIESEIWPCITRETSRYCPVLLINARLSDTSYRRWQKFSGIFSNISKNFSEIFTQSDSDEEKYKNLGAFKVKSLGNLKFSNKELEINKQDLSSIKKIINKRSVFAAASTHVEDEEVIVAAISKLLRKKASFFSVIIVRHPERRKEVTSLCDYYNLKYSLRSEKLVPDENDDVYIVDTFGELGTFFSLAGVVFVGGSFKRGGHNLLEPAYFNCAILVGPDMTNFQNITDDMIAHDAAVQFKDNKDLEDRLNQLLSQKGESARKKLADNALKYVKSRQEVLKSYLEAIDKYINAKLG